MNSNLKKKNSWFHLIDFRIDFLGKRKILMKKSLIKKKEKRICFSSSKINRLPLFKTTNYTFKKYNLLTKVIVISVIFYFYCKSLKMTEPIVYLDKVSIKNNDKIIFSNIDLKVMPGDFIFLIGKTGAGKSSLIKVIHADKNISEGLGSVVGFSLNKIRESEIPLLRRKIGVVFQDFKLLEDRNIFENLSFVLKSTGWKDKKMIISRINEVLDSVNVIENPKKFPFELSGGEQQRLAIARALLNKPKLIIADEPTGNLDPETSNEIMQLFKKLNSEGISIIMATHDYNMIMKFPGKIYKCENKKLVEVIAKKKSNN